MTTAPDFRTPDGCPHCSPLHAPPQSRPWGVYVAADRDGDNQPVRLHIQPSDGAHVAESDAAWLRWLINDSGWER